MPKDRIVIEGEPGEYYLQWYIAEEHDLAAVIGDENATEELLAKQPSGSGNWDFVACELEARKAAKATGAYLKSLGMYSGCFLWERRSDAAAALKLIKAGVAARKANRPMPDWAVQALANGWKAPKGWTP